MMSDLTELEAEKPAKPPVALKVTRRVRDAINAMVWQGSRRSDAAKQAGITDHALYCALRKPHVKAAYLEACEVLRTSGRARRIHRLEEIAEQDSNMTAAVNAIRTAEGLDDSAARIAVNVSIQAGWVIDLSSGPGDRRDQQRRARVIDADPTGNGS